MKRKAFRGFQIGTIALGIGSFLSFAGALASTVAWYAYTTDSKIIFNGTTVAETEQLQIGLQTTMRFGAELEEQYGIEYFDLDDAHYAFATPGVGLGSAIIKAYLSNASYATTELYPVTSQAYDEGQNLLLRNAPTSGQAHRDDPAESTSFVRLPLAFRVVKTGTNQYVQNQNIWLENALAVADGAGDIYKSVRVHFAGNNGSRFLLNPSEDTSNRSTAVAGLLDLDGDGYYDTEGTSMVNPRKEIIYGDYLGDLTPTLNEEATELDDVNGTGQTTETTFTAKHRENAFIYDNLNALNPKLAKYKALDDVKPTLDSNGLYTGGTVLCNTTNHINGIADLTMTVYIEGWDHTVIDQAIGHKFNLGLTFVINRVD